MEIKTEDERVNNKNQGQHRMCQKKMVSTGKTLGSRTPEKVTQKRSFQRGFTDGDSKARTVRVAGSA